jgi:hypothetical protein
MSSHWKDKPINAVKEIIAVYSENCAKHINTPFGQALIFRSVKAGGNHCDIRIGYYVWCLADDADC